MLTLICALAENRAIGLNNQLLYHLRADLQRFKALTTGHTIIMGRRTFESLPKGALPNRRNIVLSSSQKEAWPNTEIYASLEEALAACQGEETFVIGGAQLYQAALPMADRLYLTHVHDTPSEADTFFPEIDFKQWKLIKQESHPADQHNERAFTFADYERL